MLASPGQTKLCRGMGAEVGAAVVADDTGSTSPGKVLFGQGVELYISLRGHIGLRLPGTHRRLASFAPGVTMGEIALLDQRARSAEAAAETDLELLSLSAAAFATLKREHPALAAKLLSHISLHLADSVRALATELSGWVSRASMARTAPVDFTPPLDRDQDAAS